VSSDERFVKNGRYNKATIDRDFAVREGDASGEEETWVNRESYCRHGR
jgi:hypothetical protein